MRRTLSLSAVNSRLVQLTTQRWVEKYVVAKKLCPWAQLAASSEETMRVTVLEKPTMTAWQTDPVASIDLTNAILAESRALASPESKGKTTLIVVPGFTCFDTYLELSSVVDDLLHQENLDEAVQLATFHPEYRFDQTAEDDPGNFSNRSPYPILHLLRVDDVATAIATYHKLKGPTDAIWKQNVATLRSVGSNKLQAILDKIKSETLKEFKSHK